MSFLSTFQTVILISSFFCVYGSDVICQPVTGSSNACLPLCLQHQCETDQWSCVNSSLNDCTQECYDRRSCSNLSCDAVIGKCTQYCDGCQTMKCNSTNCEQRCPGTCNNITCSSAKECKQYCDHCDLLRCQNNEICRQTCHYSSCSLNCSNSSHCLQNCYGEGCSGECFENLRCSQRCNTNATCPHLLCDSNVCRQTCDKNSYCGKLHCSGKYSCVQESYVKESKLICSSSRCTQKSHSNNGSLSCGNSKGYCKQSCLGQACLMTCSKDVKTCEQTCDGGYCNMVCPRGIETCSMECPGGHCTFSCKANQCLTYCKHQNCRYLKENPGPDVCKSETQSVSFTLVVLSVMFSSLTLNTG